HPEKPRPRWTNGLATSTQSCSPEADHIQTGCLRWKELPVPERNRRGGVGDQELRLSPTIGRYGVDVVAVRIGKGVVVQPLDLVVDRTRLGDPVIGKRRQIEHPQPPAGLVADPALEGDLLTVRGERRTLDAVAQYPHRAIADTALDQVVMPTRAQGGEEAVRVPGESDAPEVEVDRIERPAVPGDAVLLQLAQRVSGSHVDDRRRRREAAARPQIGMTGNEHGHRTVASVGGDTGPRGKPGQGK